MLFKCHHEADELAVIRRGRDEYGLCDLCLEDPDRAIRIIDARRRKEWEEDMEKQEQELALYLDDDEDD